MSSSPERSGAEALASLLTLSEFEAAAEARLSRAAWDYYRSGADAETSLAENRAAFGRHQLWPRVLRDVSNVDLTTTLLGTTGVPPILVAPTAYHRLADDEGELATARAAARAGVIYVMSTLATRSIEEVAAVSTGPRWFQLYVHRDRGFTRGLVERAEAAGFSALALTVDTPILGRRLADERNRFTLPPGLEMKNLIEAVKPEDLGGSSLAAWFVSRHDATLGWKDLEWLRSITRMPIVLKGVMREDDARLAVEHGAAAVVVSNHGARQLDGVPATIDALPGVVDAVDGRIDVLLDGGVRWGTDVLKALGLGARAVLVGRPILHGLAVGGEAGVSRVLSILLSELRRAMALAGCPSLRPEDLSGLVRRRP